MLFNIWPAFKYGINYSKLVNSYKCTVEKHNMVKRVT
jgi:hypothetical protein